jgi:AraC-like DNA-binding protein
VADASRDPAIGLELGTEHRIERYDPISILAVSARSLRDALERMARYKQLACPEELRVVERGDECGEQVKGALKRLLTGRRPGIEDVAKELRLSPRTLQRRLAEDGATFQQLMQEARRELARHYLMHSSLELKETACPLGYEGAHSFFRAFHDWEGSSPGEWPGRHARSRRSRGRASAGIGLEMA